MTQRLYFANCLKTKVAFGHNTFKVLIHVLKYCHGRVAAVYSPVAHRPSRAISLQLRTGPSVNHIHVPEQTSNTFSLSFSPSLMWSLTSVVPWQLHCIFWDLAPAIRPALDRAGLLQGERPLGFFLGNVYFFFTIIIYSIKDSFLNTDQHQQVPDSLRDSMIRPR